MSPAEEEYNKSLFEETLAAEFPEEDMKDKHFRDKVFCGQNEKFKGVYEIFLGQRICTKELDFTSK